MTNRAPLARVFRATFFLSFAALSSACETSADGQGAAPGNVEVKAGLSANEATRPEPAGARLEARAVPSQPQLDVAAAQPVPGQAQLNVAAAQLAEANARLTALSKAGASVDAKAQPANPSLKVGQASANVDAKVQEGNPSLKVGKPGTLIDANVQAGKPSLNIGGLKLNASASAGTQTNE
jgi:hypothetical protein